MTSSVLDKPSTAQNPSQQQAGTQSLAPFIAALIIMVVGVVALLYLRSHQKLGAPGVKVVAVPLKDEKGVPCTTQSVPLPDHALDFRTEQLPLPIEQLSILPKDTTYGRKGYWLADGIPCYANVVLMGADRTSIHKPEFCLPGGGWHIEKKEVDTISVASSSPYDMPVTKWTVSQETRDPKSGRPVKYGGVYIFWFVNDHQITREHSGRMISIAKTMLSKGELERWAYISYLVVCPLGQEEAAYAKAKQLIGASVPQFQLVNGAAVATK
jgi:hypothetical protein